MTANALLDLVLGTQQFNLFTRSFSSPIAIRTLSWPHVLIQTEDDNIIGSNFRHRVIAINKVAPATVVQVRKFYRYGQTKQVQEILETLASLGQATQLEDGRYVKH